MKFQRHVRWRFVLFMVICISLFSVGSVFGAGFALIEQGVSGLGNAYAGGAAIADDASTIYFNPAGMARLQSHEIIAGAHIIMPYLKFRNEGSTHASGAELQGGNGGEAGPTKVVPNLYYSRRMSDSFVVGVSAQIGKR